MTVSDPGLPPRHGKIAQWNYLGPRSTPQEIRDLRKSSFDYHTRLGQPIIHKHRWTLKDVREGRAQMCPFHDQTLDSDREWCPYCFGTGILGGWDDGVITFISIADTQEDRIRVSQEGVLLMETHPQFTAPWIPIMDDEDFIITAEFAADTWEIVEEFERYELQEVTPKTMRGFNDNRRGYRVHQQGNMDKLPYNDYRYNVPIAFDYDAVPPASAIPPGADPDDYPVTPGAQVIAYKADVRIIGLERGLTSWITLGAAITGAGTSTETSFDARIVGLSKGAKVIF